MATIEENPLRVVLGNAGQAEMQEALDLICKVIENSPLLVEVHESGEVLVAPPDCTFAHPVVGTYAINFGRTFLSDLHYVAIVQIKYPAKAAAIVLQHAESIDILVVGLPSGNPIDASFSLSVFPIVTGSMSANMLKETEVK